jgi:hypothetical protein
VGVEWNAQGWDNLVDVASRTFTHTMQQAGNPLEGLWVMHDILQDTYYAVDLADDGSYTRSLIDVNEGTIAPESVLVNWNETDPVSEGVSLINLQAQATIEWNFEGWGDLSNVASRGYTSDVTGRIVDVRGGLDIEAVMHDKVHDTYYMVDFTQWSIGRGGRLASDFGGVAYDRSLIDLSTPGEFALGDVVHAIIPATSNVVEVLEDGTVLQRAYGGPLQSTQTVEWNADGWGDLTDVANRDYSSNMAGETVYNLGNRVLNLEWVMHDIVHDTYYKVDFTQWTQGGDGGGFAYERSMIDTSTGNTGGLVFYDHGDYSKSVDHIAEGVVVTRDQQHPIDSSTIRWNADGWNDLEDLGNRDFFAHMEDAVDSRLGRVVLDREWIMHDLASDVYYKFDFTHWQQRGGGGVAYTRSEILFSDGNDAGTSFEIISSAPMQTDVGNYHIDPVTGEISFTGSSDQDWSALSSSLYLVAQDAAGNRSVKQLTLGKEADAAPVFESAGEVQFVDGGMDVAYQTVATDANVGTVLSYGLSGVDAALFNIDNMGAVSFKDAPLFSAPADDGADNIYNFTVSANDGHNTSELPVALTVFMV